MFREGIIICGVAVIRKGRMNNIMKIFVIIIILLLVLVLFAGCQAFMDGVKRGLDDTAHGQSQTNSGSGYKCSVCNGLGRTQCIYCSGSGNSSNTCFFCNGFGRSSIGQCTSCNGRGYPACRFCNRLGQVTCKSCNGRGYR